jgi:hypothetical protein
MSKRFLLAGFSLACLLVAPASANWFSNPYININLNLGSAPNPTPDQVLAETLPMLVRDADGNVIAMLEPGTGKIIATAEPPPPAKPGAAAAKQSPVKSAVH